MSTRDLAHVIPDSPRELLELAERLDDHRRFVQSCGVAWPTLDAQIERPALVRATLLLLRREQYRHRRAPAVAAVA